MTKNEIKTKCKYSTAAKKSCFPFIFNKRPYGAVDGDHTLSRPLRTFQQTQH